MKRHAGLVAITILVAGISASSSAAILNVQVTTPAAPCTVDLSAQGTLDWVTWGPDGQARKAAGTGGSIGMIGDFEQMDIGTLHGYSDNDVCFTWTDGTAGSGGPTGQGVYLIGMSQGFEFRVPSSKQPRVLTLYVGVHQSRGKLEANLGDLPTFIHDQTRDDTGRVNAIYTITFQDDLERPLTIKWWEFVQLGRFDYSTLQAATLAPVPEPATLTLLALGATALLRRR